MAGGVGGDGPTAASRMRADGRRNYEGIVSAASMLIAAHGANASLEEVARRAGVGSATLHRHFPTRRALLEAVFYDQVLGLCAEARRLANATAPYDALIAWLEVLTRHGVTTRGLTTAYLHTVDDDSGVVARSATCEQLLIDAGQQLLSAAQHDGHVRHDIRAEDILHIVFGLCVTVGTDTDAVEDATRLLHLTLTGLAPP